ncbi:MAG: hypothetical protein AABZ53_15650 [Planctomycetota bacterium]
MHPYPDGFVVESPGVVIPWDVTLFCALKLFAPGVLRKIGENYLTLEATSLNGLTCTLGLHFADDGRLHYLEFFKLGTEPRQQCPVFQRQLEEALGPPTRRHRDSDGFDACRWTFSHLLAEHFVRDRFGIEERVSIWPAHAALPT